MLGDWHCYFENFFLTAATQWWCKVWENNRTPELNAFTIRWRKVIDIVILKNIFTSRHSMIMQIWENNRIPEWKIQSGVVIVSRNKQLIESALRSSMSNANYDSGLVQHWLSCNVQEPIWWFDGRWSWWRALLNQFWVRG
jgi:hypothetical protein